MPNFSNAPPAPDSERALPLKRTPAMGRIRAVITSTDLIGCNTHFYGGHTVPCEAPDCEPCQKGIPWRWHGYVSALQAGSHLHFIFEFTAQAGDTFRTYFELNQTLRGCIFDGERMHHRPNGRVILQVKPGDLATLNLPKAPDLEACMRIIWHCPSKPAVQSTRKNGHPQIQIGKSDHALANALPSPDAQTQTRSPHEKLPARKSG